MRDRVIRVRASTEELAKLQDAALARGLSRSDLIRRTAMGLRLPQRAFDHTQVQLLARILGELGRVGGNLNQMVRRANSGQLSGATAELLQALAEIDALRDHLRELVR